MSGKLFQFIFEFNSKRLDGGGEMKDLLGGKGANLAEMCRVGLPVPPGFTISTEACRIFSADPDDYRHRVLHEIHAALEHLEEVTGRKLGDLGSPLLVSVRSGAKFSMPGMMDTILNVGLAPGVVPGLVALSRDPRFVWDCYLRFVQMFSQLVLKMDGRKLEETLNQFRPRIEKTGSGAVGPDELKRLCGELRDAISRAGGSLPDSPAQQLELAVEAVFRSWKNPRAVTYRKLYDIPDDLGTAVNIQSMVFGNLGKDSGSGVGFTRNPSTGKKEFYGEFLPNAQGEEVVAGTRTPFPLVALQERLPDIYEQLRRVTGDLERHYRDMQDYEFTIETGKLYLLQTRTGKRSGRAAVQIAWDLFQEGVIGWQEALERINPLQLQDLLHTRFKKKPSRRLLARGLPASPGAEVGGAVFTADSAVSESVSGEEVILVRRETTPDDIHGMQAAKAIVTARGGMTSHAAVVARGMGKPAVVGCEEMEVDEEKRQLRVNGRVIHAGETLSVDGSAGEVYRGELEKTGEDFESGLLLQVLGLCSKVDRSMSVRANADTPSDARKARELGAVGIGLCRTEHMFFGPDRLPLMQQLILADSEPEREGLLERLKEFQREDFAGILEAMDGLPVTIRLLDPPLHEFLADEMLLREEIRQLRGGGGEEKEIALRESVLARVEELREVNPMLGHRGCRLGITFPEITRMQAGAIFEAACQMKQEGKNPQVEVMVALVSVARELSLQKELIQTAAQEVFDRTGTRIEYTVGSMIELPRAALLADQIAVESDFFSFGTNDLTQTVFGFSRDDVGKFLGTYREKQILKSDPFQTLDQEGVGGLIELAIRKARQVKPDLKIGLCGEHGGDPESIFFCQRMAMDYVSCSPYRVPIARWSTAQAALRNQGDSRPATLQRGDQSV